MALTLPVEELTRLQVIFKLTFPDDLLTFEMLSNSNITKPPPTALSGYKLHLKGSREGSGLCLKVWAHYEGGAQPKSTYEMANELEGEHSELLSPQSTETPSVTEALLESEGDLNIDIGRPVEVYPKTVNDPAWYEYQSTTQLPSDAFPCINPTGDFVNDNWFKANTPSVFLDSNNDVGPSTLQINAHFDKQMPYNYHGVPSDMPHPTFLSGIYSLREESANAPDFQQAPVSRAKSLPTVPGNTDIDALPSPSDDELQKDTSPMSSPSSSSRPFRCLDPSCGRWFKRDYTRKVHMLTHRRKDRKPFCCNFPGCPERFSRKHDRLRHEVGRHGLESEWSCLPCHRFFSSRATMERHIFDKHGDIASVARQSSS